MTVEPLTQPSKAQSVFGAARWNVRVLASGVRGMGNEVWVWWNGITKFEPTNDQTSQPTTDIFSQGYKAASVTATSEDVNVEGLAKGVRGQSGVVPLDPGTKIVRSKRRLIGEDNEITLMYWRSDELDEDTAIVQTFSVTWKDVGGSMEDHQKYTADLKGIGAPDLVQRPVSQVSTLKVEAGVTEFTITVDGQVATIDNSPAASALAVQAALEALTNLNPGDVEVTSLSATGGTMFLVVFLRAVGAVSAVKTTGTGAVTLADPQ